MKNIFFFCSHTVPTEHPNGVRLANIGQIFRENGYKVYLIGCDDRGTREFTYKGMECLIFNQPVASGLDASRKREKDRADYIRGVLERFEKPEFIVSTLFNCKAQRMLMKYCKKNGIHMIESVCEWFDKSAFSGVKGIAKLINNRYSMYFQTPRVKNIIGISSLLCDYYDSKGCKNLCLPTLVDMEEYKGLKEIKNDSSVLNIAYAGSPAKKDYIVNALRAVGLLTNEERRRLNIHLYGVKTEQLYALGLSKEELLNWGDSIICYGRIPYAEVKEKIAAADFTVLLRPDKRYANAGFPTKVGESMACGTPVIANITSDLGKYILDGNTGIVCADETPESCAEALRKALRLTGGELNDMRINAEQMANKNFDYRTYVNELHKFLDEIRQ